MKVFNLILTVVLLVVAMLAFMVFAGDISIETGSTFLMRAGGGLVCFGSCWGIVKLNRDEIESIRRDD